MIVTLLSNSAKNSMRQIKPIFIISLPRSGSTLLQRLMMGHSLIGSCGEPWLALPLMTILKDEAMVANYGHRSAVRSIQAYLHGTSGAKDVFYKASRKFLLEMYTARSEEDVEYFVDKTPRYFRILAELREMFPGTTFVFLIRSPLSVFGSILNFIEGDLKYLPMWWNDWNEGHRSIAEWIDSDDNTLTVRYEELIANPREVVSQVTEAFDLKFEEDQLEALSARQLDRGDPTGMALYSSVDMAPLKSWQAAINSITKKSAAIKWLSQLPDGVWRPFGYSRAGLLNELKQHKHVKTWSIVDCFRLCLGQIYFGCNLHLVSRLWRKEKSGARTFFN